MSKVLHSEFSAVFDDMLSQLSLKECILLEDYKINFLKRCDFFTYLETVYICVKQHSFPKYRNSETESNYIKDNFICATFFDTE